VKQLKEIRQNAVYAEGTTSHDYANWSGHD